MSNTRLMTLTRDECVILTDRTKNDDYGVEDACVAPLPLLLRLGSLYLEIVTTDGVQHEGSIAVTESECWLLRSKVTSFDKTATDPLFGVKLLRKIFLILIQFDSEMPLVLSREEGPAMTAQAKAALAKWNEAADEGDADPDPNDTKD